MSVVIVDTGCANLASVGFAFARLGVDTITTQDAKIIQNADRIVLPGVGSAGYAMEQLKARGLVQTLKRLPMPVLGICLGMQLLFEKSDEGGVDGLGLMKGTITKLDTHALPSPHMGWNRLENLQGDPLLRGIAEGEYAYFVHSYAAPIRAHTLASTAHGTGFSAIIKQGNIYGCQFHPERSGKTGARILANFAKVVL